ncbi:MAG: HEAT repeat domain-containing protein [Acidobacteria bacterium]|nr:HEAT repeat domain-containing protein [Acidobacteriota bacterium]
MPTILTVPLALAAVLLLMLLFIVGRRAWRAMLFRRLDAYQEYWLKQLPALLAGATPHVSSLDKPKAREVLESLLVRRLQTSDPVVRTQAIQLLERSGLLDSRLELLQRGSRWQRLHSAAILGQVGSPTVIPALLEALHDKNHAVRIAAVRSLGVIGSAKVAPALVRFLVASKAVDKTVWLDAALLCVTDPQQFLPLLQSERPELRALGAQAIAECCEHLAVDQLEPFVFDPDPEVRAQVARVIGKTGGASAVRLLIAATYDEEWFVRLRALAALGQLRAVAALDAVMRAMGDHNFRVRQQAAATLAALATHPEEVLQALTLGNDRYARESYLSQLARSGMLWNTLPLLCSKQDSLRRGAEELLENAIRAGYFHEVQYAAETDPDPDIRTAAARLLEKCGTNLAFSGAEHGAGPLAPAHSG